MLSLPLVFLRFWYVEAPAGIVAYLLSFNNAVLHILSLPLLVRTFFQPLKNEYRKGLVGFSIGMGIFVKTILIVVDAVFMLVILGVEAVFLLGFLLLPIATIGVLFL